MGDYSFNSKVGFDRPGGRLQKRRVSAAEVEPLGLARQSEFDALLAWKYAHPYDHSASTD